MKRLPLSITPLLQYLAVAGLAAAAFLGASILSGGQTAHALPEYTVRTGQPCATCHVNPGGGGPRTLRGLLWAANGRPDDVPEMTGGLLAPGVEDGQELYEIACAGCHGQNNEGLYAMGLAGTGISARAVRSYVLNGIPALGMPAFDNQFTAEQLDSLSHYLAGVASGSIAPPADRVSLPPAGLSCALVGPAPCGER